MTADQQIASDPGRSAWVSASAGTGKTKVLTDRVLRLLLAGNDPGSILCVTFTKAAAAEMLDRIERRLADWAVEENSTLRQQLETLMGESPETKHLQRARKLFALVLDSPVRLRVQTLHSFCQSVIARFPVEAGVPPHMQLIDERDTAEMLIEARRKLFIDAREGAGSRVASALNALATSLAESTLYDLFEKIIGARKRFMPWMETYDGVERYAAQLAARLGLQQGVSEESLKQRHFTYTPQEEEELKHAVQALAGAGTEKEKKLATEIARWFENRSDAEIYMGAFLTKEDSIRKNLYAKAFADKNPAVISTLQAEAQRVLGFADALKSQRVLKSSEHMMVLARAMLGNYRDEKQKRGVMDYDDLIMHTVQLLKRSGAASWVLFKLDGEINHLLVDEAQDTSQEQWQIVEALVSEFYAGEGARRAGRTLFVVGDEKQSIFSFQGAEPTIFDEMRLKLGNRAKDSGQAFSHVRLGLSFRSTEAVLAAVDAVFAQAPAREGLVFSESNLTHSAHRAAEPGRVEFWPLVEGDAREKADIWERTAQQDYVASGAERMATQVAEEIAGWLRQDRVLHAKGRAVCPGDIMILVQRRGSFAGHMLRALKRAGIPVAGADRLVVTEHIAVKDCMALAEFLLLPDDDMTLATLMKSPLVGLNDEALFALAYDRGGQSLWQRLRTNPDYKLQADFLSEMLARADYMPPYELFTHALVTLGKRRQIAARLGREADDPLNEFLALALTYEETHPPSLQGFMHWLTSSETEIKRDMEKGRDEVRILTVHASKGLQAPIVFLPDTSRVPKYEGSLQWFDADSEEASPLPLWSESGRADDRYMDALKQAARAETMREYRRLLYVAMTRAEDELYISGWKGERAIASDCWYQLVQAAVEAGDAWKDENGRKVLVNAGSMTSAATQVKEALKEESPPGWARVAAPQEPRPSKPLSPSRMQPQAQGLQSPATAGARIRGVLVHRLLQYLPEYRQEEWPSLAQAFVERHGAELFAWERDEVARQVLEVLTHPDFAEVFAHGSAAEVPVVGIVKGDDGPVTIAGQIDRLAVTDSKVLIVDFKTDRNVKPDTLEIPLPYRQQLEAYRTLVKGIYPDKTIKCAILWTSVPMLQELA